MPASLGSRPSLCGSIVSGSFSPCHLSPKVVIQRLAAVGGERFGGVHFESFPVGFSMPGLSDSYFVFPGDNISERLAN